MFMAFLLASSWLPASKKRIERIRSGAGDGESAGINRTQENRLAVVGLFASYPWGPCSSRRSSRAPSWTSARCRRPWLSTPAPTKKRIWEGLGLVCSGRRRVAAAAAFVGLFNRGGGDRERSVWAPIWTVRWPSK
jgi:hypothetical protein